MSRPALFELVWPAARLGEALAQLAGSGEREPDPIPAAIAAGDDDALDRWIEIACARLGIEAEPVAAPLGDVDQLVRDAGPALVRLAATADQPGGFLVLGRGRRGPLVIAPDHRRVRVPRAELRAALVAGVEARAATRIEPLLARVAPARRARARRALIADLARHVPVARAWIVRAPPSAPLWRLAAGEGLGGRLAAIVAGHALGHLLWLASWWTLGRGALAGRLDGGWLAAWALLIVSSGLVRLFVVHHEGRFAITAGALLKRRLLYGALQVPTDEIRSQGSGRLLSRVLESEAVESLAIAGGTTSLEAVVELAAAPVVLAWGPVGPSSILILIAWLAATTWLIRGYARRRAAWTRARAAMTHELVERTVGHRTRVVQEPRGSWNRGADHDVAHYLDESAALDTRAAVLQAVIPRGWLIAGLAALVPAFTAGASPLAIAIGLGGVLLGYRALSRLTGGVVQLIAAGVAFRAIAPLERAATRPEPPGIPAYAAAAGRGDTVLRAHDLGFRYSSRTDPVLRGVDLSIAPGDRVLVEGPSGGGKSTLAALLAGLRDPERGVLLLGGLDRATLGRSGWRQRVASAPQFHDNHVLTETLAFNVLMGRRWPPTPEDLAEAEEVCRQLGLGPLLDRMPAGMMQIVGETGWQLSHGERSRVFLARALLQRADVVILDESFAALDPVSLERAMRLAIDRAPALLVIAHP